MYQLLIQTIYGNVHLVRRVEISLCLHVVQSIVISLMSVYALKPMR